MEDSAQTLTGDPSTQAPEFDDPPADPVGLLDNWITAAERQGVREPRALVLATADGDGRVSSRVVVLKALEADGLMFSSQYGSRKGRDAEVNPYASGTLYWRETLQQVNVRGRLERLDDVTADRLFAERPRAAQAIAVASRQSEPFDEGEEALRAAVRKLVESSGDIARPPGWGGYRLVFDEVEFWCGSPDRLHRRLRYNRTGTGWDAVRLQP